MSDRGAEPEFSADASGPAAGRTVRRVTWVGLGVNLILSAVKTAAGIRGDSQALVADGVHSLTDCVTDVAVILGSYFWSRPPDEGHPHGHQRLETLVTLFIGSMILLAGIGIAWHALASLHRGATARPGWIALGAAGASLVVKEALYRWTQGMSRRVNSSALAANAWHHRLDALSSVPALVAVAGAMVFPQYPFIDHAGALAVSILILKAAVNIFRPAVKEILEGGAPQETRQQIVAIACRQPGVVGIHHLRTRFLGAGLRADFHLVVDGDISVRAGHGIATTVKNTLLAEMHIVADVVVHVEPEDDDRHDHCPPAPPAPDPPES